MVSTGINMDYYIMMPTRIVDIMIS